MSHLALLQGYRRALKLALACDEDLLAKSLLSPPVVKHRPIPLTVSIRELVRSGFRTAVHVPPPVASSLGSQRIKGSGRQGKENQSPSSRALGATATPALRNDAAPTAFFAIRWLHQAVALSTELRKHKAVSASGLPLPPAARGEAQHTSVKSLNKGRGVDTRRADCNSAKYFPQHPQTSLFPLQPSLTQTMVLVEGDVQPANAAPLSTSSVLYSHPSNFDDSLYRGLFVCATEDGWGGGEERQFAQARPLRDKYQKEGKGRGGGAGGPAADSGNMTHGATPRRKKKEAAKAFPIIRLDHKTEGFTRELFDAMPQLLFNPNTPTLTHPTSSSSCTAPFSSFPSAVVTTVGHRNVLGKLPVYLGGPHANPSGPLLVHSNHTITYLLAARKGPLAASTAVARPFYVAPLSEVMSLPLRVIGTLCSSNCRVVVNQYNNRSDLGTGTFLHDLSGRSAPIALFGIASALMTPAAAAAVAAGRAPAPTLPPHHNDWAVGLRACGLPDLGAAGVLSPSQRAAVRSARSDVWDSGGSVPALTTTEPSSSSSSLLPSQMPRPRATTPKRRSVAKGKAERRALAGP